LSLTPLEDKPLAASQITSNQPDRPQHPLLDERLVGAQLRVVINDGETYKNREVTVLIAQVEGIVLYDIMSIIPQEVWPLHGCCQ
jgi:hypothetical protein